MREGRADMRRNRLVFGCLLPVILALAGVWHVLTLLFSESLYFSRPSLAYYLLVPSEVSDWKCPGATGEPRFRTSCGDGCLPPSAMIMWPTSQAPAVLASATAQYLTGHGYRFLEKEHGREHWQKQDLLMQTWVTEDPPGPRTHFLERIE